MLELYKKYPYETSILDDFVFYEKKQENIMNKNSLEEQMYSGGIDGSSFLGGVILGNENLNNYNTNIGINNNRMMNDEANMSGGYVENNYEKFNNMTRGGNQQGISNIMPQGKKIQINPMNSGNVNFDMMKQMNTPIGGSGYMNVPQQDGFNNMGKQGFNPQVDMMMNPTFKNSMKKLKRVNSTDNVTKHTN
jgi:hypothetical protein